MTACEYFNCPRRARFFMGWENENGKKHFGFVCATHDRLLGRTNLTKIGMTTEQAILFERYLRETDGLKKEYPDFPEWLAHKSTGGAHTPPSKTESETHPTELLDLPPVTQNALRRYKITSIEKLASMSDGELLKVRRIGTKGLHEIQKALEEFKSG